MNRPVVATQNVALQAGAAFTGSISDELALWLANSSSFGGFFADASRNSGYLADADAALPSSQESGSFDSREFRERIEAGRRFDFGNYGITPFAALEVATLDYDGFTESSNGRIGNPALNVNGGNILLVPAFIGGRLDGNFRVGVGWLLTRILSLAYVHEFLPVRDITANLTALPGESFLVNGARPAYDAVQVKPGFNWRSAMEFRSSVISTANSPAPHAITRATGGIKISWQDVGLI